MNRELYRAVKWEVNTYPEDHGMNLVQMWKTCRVDEEWRDMCLSDYRLSTRCESWTVKKSVGPHKRPTTIAIGVSRAAMHTICRRYSKLGYMVYGTK